MSVSQRKTDLNGLGFSDVVALGGCDWAQIPDEPGVYVIFDQDEVIYVGMAGRDGKGSRRRRLKDHASGQVVNMFAQYLLFDRILTKGNPPKTPREATLRCRDYIRSNCLARYLVAPKEDARAIEAELRSELNPTFNGTV
ncbi:hypothetical protein HKCCSP123_03155 [Rhodobacterales bacterium HKCCSP123]|nr:hypothetical protein [Rhodobacterales bacterium HKCCSP123]